MSKKRVLLVIFFIIAFIICIIFSHFYYNNKLIISFETGTTEEILPKYVSKNETVEEPKPPTKEGYVFKEWQLNGQPFDFSTKITSNIVLTAKWVKEEYIVISFNTNSSLKIDDIRVLKGETLTDLPIPSLENSEFVGWYLNDKLYNNQPINSSITLTAVYESKPENSAYQIGDSILIVGDYAESAYSDYAMHSLAIGWNRVILDILDDTNYPYMIGNERGVTGFFKSESIKKDN